MEYIQARGNFPESLYAQGLSKASQRAERYLATKKMVEIRTRGDSLKIMVSSVICVPWKSVATLTNKKMNGRHKLTAVSM